MMWETVAAPSGVACMARGRLLQVGSHAIGSVAASVALVKAKRRGEAASPPLPLLQETCACPPLPYSIPAPHAPALTLQPPESAPTLLSPLIDFEITSANRRKSPVQGACVPPGLVCFSFCVHRDADCVLFVACAGCRIHLSCPLVARSGCRSVCVSAALSPFLSVCETERCCMRACVCSFWNIC
jgi:hypothetical protein